MHAPVPSAKSPKGYLTLGMILIVGLAHGFLYLFIVPPWQHYDEPGNFEYAWLIANHEGLPQKRERDKAMRREIAASMLENGFYENLGGKPNMLSQNKPIKIGIAQTTDPPLYYQLVSLPLSLLSGTDITLQLLVGRSVSLILSLICIASAWGIMQELTAPNNPSRWLIPLTLALIPGYVDIMTSVNNDVGAIAFFSLFLWGSVSTIKRGLSWTRLLWIVVTTLLCLYTKATVYFALPLLGITILLAILGLERRQLALYIFGASAIALLLIAFTWGEVAKWYRHDPYNFQTRAYNSDAPLGDFAFLFAIQKDGEKPQISQTISFANVDIIKGKTVTIGSWVWADKSITVRLPILSDGKEYTTQRVDIGRKPSFYAFHVEIDEEVERIHVILSPLTKKSQINVNIYFDGVLLTPGRFQSDSPPVFENSMGRKGIWEEKTFENLLENPSAESGGITIRPRVDAFIQKNFPINITWAINSIFDWNKSTWYYKLTSANLLRTFWAKFGWGNIPLLGNKPYQILAGFTLLNLVGAVWYLLRRNKYLPWNVMLLFGLTLLLIWGAAIFRGVFSPFTIDNRVFIPAARYAYPAIIPTMLILNAGWLEIVRLVQKWLKFPRRYFIGLYILFFIGLDVLSILSIYRHYYA